MFNGEGYIGEAIDSVLSQRNTDLELIVVNDGSTDRTLEIIQAYSKTDTRVSVISRPNSGRPSFPKNDGLAAACGEYICFLDHDDLYDADRTWQLVDALDKHPQWVAVFHDLRMINSDGGLLPGTYLSEVDFLVRSTPYLTHIADDWYECDQLFYVHQSLEPRTIHTQSVLIAKNRLPANTLLFDTQFTLCEDNDLWIRLGLLGRMGYLNRVLSSYRQHGNSITKNRERYLIDTVRLHQHNFNRIKKKLPTNHLRTYRARISSYLNDLGYFYYLRYRLIDARTAYRQSLTYSPSLGGFRAFLKTFLPTSVIQGLKKLIR